ncbi:unnamed protein product [Rangifer tarandus platyrhynchus]|uniref:Uncharacterized protein n=2 Tax=Rangifer tarandus platyrhynchus TaxID=3082113 RepID=A0ABN8Z141_RANTA|nr:unnamed protein product [Rangifer tarandus platyrhynchus]CAI9694293.1 unnamed protein product [Rangifer tarandus platyrhynchus]
MGKEPAQNPPKVTPRTALSLSLRLRPNPSPQRPLAVISSAHRSSPVPVQPRALEVAVNEFSISTVI